MIKNISLPHIKLPSKRLLLIVAGVAVVGLLLTFATIKEVNQERAQSAAKADQDTQAYEAVKANTKRIETLETQVRDATVANTALSADKQTLCAASKPVVALRTARTTAHCQ